MATPRQRGNDIGPMGKLVGAQVKRYRQMREMTQSDLSRVLTAVGRPMPVASIGRLESGTRKIDVDDMIALANALNVAPVALLVPYTESPGDLVPHAGSGVDVTALGEWAWALTGGGPMVGGSVWFAVLSADDDGRRAQPIRALPWWLKVDVDYERNPLGQERSADG